MPTSKPPLKLSDASGLQDSVKDTDQLLGLRLTETDTAKRNVRFSARTLTDYFRSHLSTQIYVPLSLTEAGGMNGDNVRPGVLYPITGDTATKWNTVPAQPDSGTLDTVVVMGLENYFGLVGVLLDGDGIPRYEVNVNVGLATYAKAGSQAAGLVNVPLLDPTRTDYPQGFEVRQVYGGFSYLFSAKLAGGPFPAPASYLGSGDWDPVALPTAPTVLALTYDLGYAQHVIRDHPTPGVLYSLPGAWNGGAADQIVEVEGGPTGFAKLGTLLSGGVRTPVQVDVAAGTAVAIAGDGYTKAQIDAYNLALANATDAQKKRIDALLAGADSSVDTFIEAYNRFVKDESAAAALNGQVSQLQTIQAQHTQQIGTLTSLTTTAKTNLVAAVNELAARAAAKYYATTGQNPDGAMTQKASTDLFALKANTINSIDWVNQAHIYVDGDGSRQQVGQAGIGRSVVLQTTIEAAYTLPFGDTPAVVASRIGGIFAIRSEVDCTATTIALGTNADGSPRLVDGQATLVLKKGEWILLRFLATGYSIEQRGTTAAPGTSSSGGTATGTQEIQVATDTTYRVAALALTKVRQLLSVSALASRNASSVRFQVNAYRGGAWAAGMTRTALADANADMQALTGDDYANGAELLLQVAALNNASNARAIVSLAAGADALMVLPANRAALRVNGGPPANYVGITSYGTYEETDTAHIVASGPWYANGGSYYSAGGCLVGGGNTPTDYVITVKCWFTDAMRFDLISQTHPSLGTLAIQLDGQPYDTADERLNAGPVVTFYTSGILAPGEHTLVFTPSIAGLTTLWDAIRFYAA